MLVVWQHISWEEEMVWFRHFGTKSLLNNIVWHVCRWLKTRCCLWHMGCVRRLLQQLQVHQMSGHWAHFRMPCQDFLPHFFHRWSYVRRNLLSARCKPCVKWMLESQLQYACTDILHLNCSYKSIKLVIITSPAVAVAKYCDEYVCLCVRLSVCLSARISLEPHSRSLPNFLCMLPMSMAWSSSGMLTVGRIAYRREGVKGVHSTGEVLSMIALLKYC